MPSSSKSQQSQESLAVTDNSTGRTLNTGGGTGQAVNLGSARTLSKVKIDVRNEGIAAQDFAQVVSGLGVGAANLVEKVSSNSAAATSALADSFRSASGAESEAGRLVNKLAIPVLIGLAAWMFLKTRR